MKKKILSVILAVVMLASYFTVMAFADTTATQNRNGYVNYDHSYDEALAEAFRKKVVDITDDKYGLVNSTYQQITQYVYLTHPEIYGILDVVRSYYYPSGATKSYTVSYVDDMEAYEDRLAHVNAEIDALIPQGASEVEKVLIAHDYIVSTYAYNQVLIDNGGLPFDSHDYTAPGVFLKHYAVCRGVSHAYKYVLDHIGIDSAIVESTACNHVWNLVKIGNEWYHVDLSYDNPTYDVLGEVAHDYFLLSTGTLLEKEPKRADFEVLYKDLNYVFSDDTCALDKQYESGQPWSDTRTVVHVYDGHYYTMGTDSAIYKDGELFYQPSEYMQWHPFGITSAIYTNAIVTAKMTAIGKDLYFNSPRNIYHLDLDTGVAEVVYSPSEVQPWVDPASGEKYPNQNQIFGLSRMEGKLYISIEDNLPQGNETWTYVPGFDYEYDVIPLEPYVPEEPETVKGFLDSATGETVDSLYLISDMGKTLTVKFVGLNDGETLSVSSTNPSSATASVSGDTISIKTLINGTASIKVTCKNSEKELGTYSLSVGVNKNYTTAKTVNLTFGDKTVVTDTTGDYSQSFNATILDKNIADVSVKGISTAGTAAKAASVKKLTGYSEGYHLIGYTSGSTTTYLVANGTSISTTTDPSKATEFKFSGNSSSFTISASGYYLVHSTSAVSLSTSSTNGTWKMSSGKICFAQASGRRTTTYYLRYYRSSFSVSTSSTYPVYSYDYTAGTAATEGVKNTEITITSKGVGTTYAIVGNTLYTINVAKAPSTQIITVNVIDDLGNKLRDSYTVTGTSGNAYTITPEAISGYTTPAKVTGTFTDEDNKTINLVYYLNTDKTALNAALATKLSSGTYTAASYQTYENAYTAAKNVADNSRATQSEVDTALNNLNTAKNALKKITYTVTVNYVDDLGNKLLDSEIKTGEIGTSYTVTPKAVASYTAPAAVSGTFTENKTITLTYTLNTDKSALKTLIENKVEKGEYTDVTYSSYLTAYNNGVTVYNNARALQSEVDTAVSNITTAKNSLKVASKVTFIRDTDGINSGKEYIISYNGYALSAVNGSLTAVKLDVSSDGVSGADDSSVWVITKYSTSYKVQNKATGQYLTTGTSGSIFNRTYNLALTSTAATWKLTTSGSNMLFNKSSRYLTYSGSAFGLTTSKSSNTGMALYVKA